MRSSEFFGLLKWMLEDRLLPLLEGFASMTCFFFSPTVAYEDSLEEGEQKRFISKSLSFGSEQRTFFISRT